MCMVKNPGLKHKHEYNAQRENRKRKVYIGNTAVGTEAIKHI
jgi:hypothetical protein